MTLEEAYKILGQFPHCDSRVLHSPGKCQYCDMHPQWQALRVLYRINFTGESDPEMAPCPADAARPGRANPHGWHGNRPTEVPVEELFPPTHSRFARISDEGDE